MEKWKEKRPYFERHPPLCTCVECCKRRRVRERQERLFRLGLASKGISLNAIGVIFGMGLLGAGSGAAWAALLEYSAGLGALWLGLSMAAFTVLLGLSGLAFAGDWRRANGLIGYCGGFILVADVILLIVWVIHWLL